MPEPTFETLPLQKAGDRWSLMLRRQNHLQTDTFKMLPVVDRDDRAYYVTWNGMAFLHELVEAMQEMSWKPWAEDDFFRRDAYLKELVDAWHFLMNLILVAKLEDQSEEQLAEEFYRRYIEKSQVNWERQQREGGYRVLGTKCSDCGRAIEDGIRIPLEDNIDRGWAQHAYRCFCGRVNYLDPATS